MMRINSPHKKTSFGLMLAATSAVATGTFGIFLNYFSSLGISDNALSTFTPMAVLLFYLTYTLITQPKALILPRKLFYFTLIVCSGLIFSPLYIYTSVRSFNTLPVAVASLLDFSNAIVLVFLMRIFFKSKITKTRIIACIIAFLGMLCVLNVFGTSVTTITGMGLIWGFANCFSLAFAYLFDYFHITNGVPFMTYLVYSNAVSFMLFSLKTSPLQMFQEFSIASATGGGMMWLMLLLYFIVIVISYGTIAISYNYIEASTASLAFVLEPATATLLGFFILGQALNGLQIIGMVIAVSAIIYMQYTADDTTVVPKKKRLRFSQLKNRG